MINVLDEGLGTILNKLKEKSLEKNTIDERYR
jgi:hypothetical protein